MKNSMALPILVFLSLASGVANADGASIYNASCISCHGPAAVGMASPVLEGQNKNYLTTQLGDFKSGARHDSMMNAMNGMAATLDAVAMADVAAFLSSQNACDFPASIVTPGLGDVNSGKSAVQAHSCTSCHMNNGPFNAPGLNGQKTAYLVAQLNDFKSGARKSQYMNSMASPLSDRDINDISAYLNSLRKCP